MFTKGADIFGHEFIYNITYFSAENLFVINLCKYLTVKQC